MGVRVPTRLAQEELDRRSDASRKWICTVESGSRLGAEFGKLLAVIRALGRGRSALPTGVLAK